MEVEKGGGVGGGEEKERSDVKREKLFTEVREVVEKVAGVRRERVDVLVLGAQKDHHQWNGVGVRENHRRLERVVVVHEIVVAHVENHLPRVALHFTTLIRTNANHALLNPLLQVFGKNSTNII